MSDYIDVLLDPNDGHRAGAATWFLDLPELEEWMGFLRRFFGSAKEQVSPEEFGKRLVPTAHQLATQGDSSPQSIIVSSNPSVDTDNPRYLLELVSFALFHYDVVVARDFPNALGLHIRSALRDQFISNAAQVYTAAGQDPPSPSAIESQLVGRFEQYVEASKDIMNASKDVRAGEMSKFGQLAYRNIVGEKGNLQAYLALAEQHLRYLVGIPQELAQYQVTEAELAN